MASFSRHTIFSLTLLCAIASGCHSTESTPPTNTSVDEFEGLNADFTLADITPSLAEMEATTDEAEVHALFDILNYYANAPEKESAADDGTIDEAADKGVETGGRNTRRAELPTCSNVFQDALETKVRASKNKLGFIFNKSGVKCLDEDEVAIEMDYTTVLKLIVEGDSVDLSKLDGSTLTQVFPQLEDLSVSGTSWKHFVASKFSQTKPSSEGSGQVQTTSYTLSGTADGDMCGGKIVGSVIHIDDGCLDVHSIYDSSTGKWTFSKRSPSSLTKNKDKTSLFFTGGKYFVTQNNWTGEITYTDANTAPTFNVQNEKGETLSITLSLHEGTSDTTEQPAEESTENSNFSCLVDASEEKPNEFFLVRQHIDSSTGDTVGFDQLVTHVTAEYCVSNQEALNNGATQVRESTPAYPEQIDDSFACLTEQNSNTFHLVRLTRDNTRGVVVSIMPMLQWETLKDCQRFLK
jgi:hypothetical protein